LGRGRKGKSAEKSVKTRTRGKQTGNFGSIDTEQDRGFGIEGAQFEREKRKKSTIEEMD